MVGTTLIELREYIEDLASDAGEYYLVCSRRGGQPVPATGLRFERRATARAAARATEQYRVALRRYDPRLPHYDVIVCQEGTTADRAGQAGDRRSDTGSTDWTLSEPVLDRTSAQHQDLVEFCHRVAAVVFETLSEDGYDAVETAVMDEYVALAETVADPDDLCLCLLESVATELDRRLSPAEQADVLADAAARLTSLESAGNPVSATLDRLEESGLLESYTRSPWSTDLDEGTRSAVVRLSEYALSPRYGRLPVLPVVLDLHRRQPDWQPSSLRVVGADDGWRVRIVVARERESEPEGLASAPITE